MGVGGTGARDKSFLRPAEASRRLHDVARWHTAVFGPGSKPLEIQIRTREMHLFAEFGVAARWAYKEGKRDASKAERFQLLRRLVDWQKQLVDPRELAEAPKTDLFEDQVHVFNRRAAARPYPATTWSAGSAAGAGS